MTQPHEADPAPETTEAPEVVPVEDVPPAEEAAADSAPADAQDDPAEAPADDAAEAEEPPKDKPPVRTLVDVLRDQLLDKETQLHEYIQAYKSAKADMEDRIARLQRDREKVIDRDRKNIAKDLLEVLDNLDRSIASMADPSDADGVRMVHRQFAKVLTEFGVERQEAMGDMFDANVHEAIGMIPAQPTHQDQEIIHVDRAGYTYKGELLRPARVIVATKA